MAAPQDAKIARRKARDVWRDMIRRCSDPAHKSYRNYGARGITVCERWRASFKTFQEDMGDRPSSAHSIDRINNNGNYEPGNCRWATASEQRRNQRPPKAFGATLVRGSRWQAQIHINGKNHYLGVFETAEEARAVYFRARAAAQQGGA